MDLRAGALRLHLSWTVRGDSTAGYDLAVTIAQTQHDSTTFTTPIDLGVALGSRDTTISVALAAGVTTSHIRFRARPGRVTLDPGNWLLKEVVP